MKRGEKKRVERDLTLSVGSMLVACRPKVRRRTTGAELVEYRRFMRSMAAIMGRLCLCLSVSYSNKC